jgi:hypothetical protein
LSRQVGCAADCVEKTEVAVSLNMDEGREPLLLGEYQVYVEDLGRQGRSQSDILMDVTNKLQEARLEARGLNDKLFLYFIDTAIFHACEMLDNQSDLGEQEKWS